MSDSERSWADQLRASDDHWFKTQAHDTKSLRAGDLILMPSAVMIDRYIRAIPEGEASDVSSMRRDLAERHDVATTCPVTTGIQLRIVGEAAHEALAAGASIEEITPVWRVLDRKATVLKKLSFDPAFILEQREREASS
jgi:hypothetical protein